MKLAILLPLSFCLSLSAFAQSPNPLEKRVVAAAKQADVNKLDKLLPHLRFDQWLRRQVGASALIVWESNDCGEQDGSGKQSAADIPLCGEASAKLADGRKVLVQVAVGSLRDGIRGPAALWFLYVEGKDHKGRDSAQLSDLPKLLLANK